MPFSARMRRLMRRGGVERSDVTIDVVVIDGAPGRKCDPCRCSRRHRRIESAWGSPVEPRAQPDGGDPGAKYSQRCDTDRYGRVSYCYTVVSTPTWTAQTGDYRMANSKTLVKNLKAVLKLRGVTYRELAGRLKVSEPTIQTGPESRHVLVGTPGSDLRRGGHRSRANWCTRQCRARC